MFHAAVCALSLLAASIFAPAETPDGAPRLRLSRLDGRLEVEAPDGAARVFPYILPGSVVRVLYGAAVFDSDYHATVRVLDGDAFRFTSAPPEGASPGVLLISAVERTPRGLEVSVGDRKFRLGKGGLLSVAAAWPGEMTVRPAGGRVEQAPGSLSEDGSVLSAARRMKRGDEVVVPVPDRPGFENAAVSASSLSVARADAGAYVVQAGAAPGTPGRARGDEARRAIAGWPAGPERTAEALIEKYGPPDLAMTDRAVWYDRGPWRITTVYRNPQDHLDVLEQTIAYPVPQDKIAALAELDVALRLNRGDRTLSAVSESEETNMLALNLADEVVHEKRSAEEARRFYLKTIVERDAGKSSPYTARLLFR